MSTNVGVRANVRVLALLLAVMTFVVTATPVASATSQNVYRFRNTNGAHFYTATNSEWWDVVTTPSSPYAYEGRAWTLDSASPSATRPLHRFYKWSSSSHFYTASDAEKASLMLNPGYRYDGVAYYVSSTLPNPGITVYRFYYLPLGSHFYTADVAERDAIIRNLGGTYHYDGVAFYVPTAPAAPAPEKTVRNYCVDWLPVGAGTMWPVAEQATWYQQQKGYAVANSYSVTAGTVYDALKARGVVVAGSHSNAGYQIYRTSSGVWTCVATHALGDHSHTVGKWTCDCDGTKDLRGLRGTNTPTRMVVWMGCRTSMIPSGANSLPRESQLAGVDHNAAFAEEIYINTEIDTWASDYAYGYWKSLYEGNYASQAEDDATLRVRWCNWGLAGGYESHSYLGPDIRL